MFVGSRLSHINHSPVRSFQSPVDGHIRHEIDDSSSQMLFDEDQIRYYARRQQPVDIQSCFCHPALLAAYPELKPLPVLFDPALRGARLSFAQKNWRVQIGIAGPHPEDPLEPQHARTNMLHELQHLVQIVEKRGNGTSPEWEDQLERQRRINRLMNLRDKHNKESRGWTTVTQQLAAVIAKAEPQEQSIRFAAHRRYFFSRHEIEAYDTEARRDYSVHQRRKIPSALECLDGMGPRAALRALRGATNNYTCNPQFDPALSWRWPSTAATPA